MDGYASTLVGIFTRARKSANCLAPTCFIMYAVAQFLDHASADAMVIVLPVQLLLVAGTSCLFPKSCCWSSTSVSALNPRSSIACKYNNGLIVDPTCRWVFRLA